MDGKFSLPFLLTKLLFSDIPTEGELKFLKAAGKSPAGKIMGGPEGLISLGPKLKKKKGGEQVVCLMEENKP